MDLGTWYQINLKFYEHINYIVNIANRLGLIKQAFKSLDKDSFLILFQSLIGAILDYCSVYYPCAKKDIQLLKRHKLGAKLN